MALYNCVNGVYKVKYNIFSLFSDILIGFQQSWVDISTNFEDINMVK